jgi:hypothetical protein
LSLVHHIGSASDHDTREKILRDVHDAIVKPRLDGFVQQRTPPHALVDAIARMVIEDMRPERLALTPAFVEVCGEGWAAFFSFFFLSPRSPAPTHVALASLTTR